MVPITATAIALTTKFTTKKKITETMAINKISFHLTWSFALKSVGRISLSLFQRLLLQFFINGWRNQLKQNNF
jgi:hypothetical protein